MSESESKYELHRSRKESPHDVTVEAEYDSATEAIAQARRDAESDEEHVYEVAVLKADDVYEVVWSSRV